MSSNPVLTQMRGKDTFVTQLQKALLSHGNGKYALITNPSTSAALFHAAAKIDVLFWHGVEVLINPNTEVARKPVIYTFLKALECVALCVFQVVSKTENGAPSAIELNRTEYYAEQLEKFTHASRVLTITSSGMLADEVNPHISRLVDYVQRCINLLKNEYRVHDISSLNAGDQSMLKLIEKALFKLEATMQLLPTLPEGSRAYSENETDMNTNAQALSAYLISLNILMTRTSGPLSEMLSTISKQVSAQLLTYKTAKDDRELLAKIRSLLARMCGSINALSTFTARTPAAIVSQSRNEAIKYFNELWPLQTSLNELKIRDAAKVGTLSDVLVEKISGCIMRLLAEPDQALLKQIQTLLNRLTASIKTYSSFTEYTHPDAVSRKKKELTVCAQALMSILPTMHDLIGRSSELSVYLKTVEDELTAKIAEYRATVTSPDVAMDVQEDKGLTIVEHVDADWGNQFLTSVC